jgi:hypothetical protein
MIEYAGRRYIDTIAAFSAGARAGNLEGQNYGLMNWGKMISTISPLGNAISGTKPQPDAVTAKALQMNQAVMSAPRNGDDLFLLNLNAANVTQADTVQKEFTIQYILGQTTDYDGFVRRWLAAGGQALLNEATTQLRGYGRIR